MGTGDPCRPGVPGAWPDVDVIVPFRNEADHIAAKVADCATLDYPRSLHFWFVDGLSSDGSGSIAAGAIEWDRRFSMIGSDTVGKPAQVAVGMAHGTAPWVLVTDVDARLPRDAVMRLVAAGETDAVAGVIGSLVEPIGGNQLEVAHWRLVNRMRMRESCGGGATVVGPCYLFRRQLLHTFPDDVVADDAHVSFTAAVAGFDTRLIDVRVGEVRVPVTTLGVLAGKIRKASAYVREVGRFLPRTASMDPAARRLFRRRATMLALTPLLTLFFTALAVAALALSGPRVVATVLAVVALPLAIPLQLVPRRLRNPLVAARLATIVAIAVTVAAFRLCRWALASGRSNQEHGARVLEEVS